MKYRVLYGENLKWFRNLSENLKFAILAPDFREMTDSLVIIPTYNEKENIESMLEYVLALEQNFHVLVVDDCSPDGTADLVKAKIAKYPEQIFIIERVGKLGLGTAYIAGFEWALTKSYAFIFEMDADFSHNPDDLMRLYEACSNGADMSIGSRYVSGGKVENWPLTRIMMSYFASVYVWLVLWVRIKDATAGFVCYRREVLETLNLSKIRFKGYAFQIEMKYTAWLSGFKLKEVPITFKDRVLGKSKMNTSIFKEAFFGVLLIRGKDL